jgi:cytochrome c-type biogenesis protein CcmH
MTLFLVLAALLFVVGAGLLTRPLWRGGRWRRAGALHRDVDALALQLRQLTALHGAGALTDEQFLASKSLVERRLLDTLVPQADGEAAAATPARPGGSLRLQLGLVAFMLAVAAGGYTLVGTPGALHADSDVTLAPAGPDAEAPSEAASGAHALTATQINAMVAKLEERLKTDPDDAQGWMMLARSRVALGQHAQSLDAFARAERLRPDDASLLADHADALAMTQQGRLEGAPSDLIRRALQIDPHDNKALALAGTAAFDRKDYKEAVRDWETLARVEPADGPFADQVRGGIAQARQLAGMPPSEPASAAAGNEAGATASRASAVAPGAATVTGTVSLAPELAGSTSPDDVLFVFARAPDGPRMPVAILRKRVRDLPLSFTLDDSLAMAPENDLSSVARVVVGARISHSGNAMAQDGDLQGQAAAVAVGTTGIRVEINQRVTR